MQTENRLLMQNAWESFDGRWGNAAVATLLYFVIIMAISFVPYVGGIVAGVLGGPMALGFIMFIIAYYHRAPDAKVDTIFSGFKYFGNAFLLSLVQGIFVLLWTLLFIIPGIMASYSYAMSYFILAENPNMASLDAIKESKRIMYGNRWKLFCLDIRFIGWFLLAIITLGIVGLWVQPYYMTARYLFYRDLVNPGADCAPRDNADGQELLYEIMNQQKAESPYSPPNDPAS